jgi:hypothetical protein
MTMMAGHNMETTWNGHRWIAADLEVRSDDVLVGLIGYSTSTVRTEFDDTEWSWLKGTKTIVTGADDRTLAPFAVDLDSHRRWVTFAPVGYVNEQSFAAGFQAVLNEALRRQDEGFSDWEVDMVSSGIALREWVETHPDVIEMKLTLRMSNPGRDLTSDRAQMRALGSARMEKTFYPARARELHVSEELEALEGELARTDTDVLLRDRAGSRYDSRRKLERQFITDFGDDLRLGMDLVADALRAFSAARTPPTMTGDPDDEVG